MSSRRKHTFQKIAILPILLVLCTLNTFGQQEDKECGGSILALKSNLLHDALLTPDLGLEFSLTPSLSVGLEGVYAWWRCDHKHRYWRLRGAWLDASWWFGRAARTQRLTGHHAGIYASIHDFDFEFGGKGWQSRRPTFGAGLTYGYSLRLNGHLSLDLSVRAGYADNSIIEYRPMCGTYVCINEKRIHYFGLTGVGISLVWFPAGRKACKNPPLE